MRFTNTEFEALLSDDTKAITGDIRWEEDEDHSPSKEFRVEVHTSAGYPLFVRGSYNALAQKLTYALILKTVGRVYALDLGSDHHNPTCEPVGEKHKHQWTEQFRDKQAYVPSDITASATSPVDVWQQFCEEAGIKHDGKLAEPPPFQGELWP